MALTPRLLIDLVGSTPVFKLSKPGIDVNVASEDNLLFNMATGGYGGVFMSGIVPQSAFTLGTFANPYFVGSHYRYEIPFGKTFSALPKVLMMVNDPVLGAGWYGPQLELNGEGCYLSAEAQVKNDRLILMMVRTYNGQGQLYNYPANMSYVVYHV